MELKENLSKNLILLRGPKSQAAFSEKLGVTKSTIQAIEAKKSAVRLDTLDIIARNLGLPAPALLSEELTYLGGCETAALHPGTGRMVCSALQPRSERHTMLAPGHCKCVATHSG